MTSEEEDDPRTTPGREIWRRRCGQQDTSGRLEEDGGGSTEPSSRWEVVGSVDCTPPTGATWSA